MQIAGPLRAWSAVAGRGSQGGQALIYGLFVLIGGLAGLFFLFNTGQLAREKTKLVNTTDAVAYSGGVINARALNFHAYSNRAMMANTVAIAQMVSLSSWLEYATIYGQTLGPSFESGAYAAKYPVMAPGALLALYALEPVNNQLNESGSALSLETIALLSDASIRGLLMNSQRVAHGSLVPARTLVMQQVADANYINDGQVTVDSLTLMAMTSRDDYLNFVAPYSDDQRTRFAEVSRISAHKDGFVRSRSWTESSIPFIFLISTPLCAIQDRMIRNGGTDLVGFDQWVAGDSLSERFRRFRSFSCRNGAIQWANGDADASSEAAGAATSDSWEYSGLPTFYDLSNTYLVGGDLDPKLGLVVRVLRSKDQTRTSEARSEIKNNARLNNYQAQTAGGNNMVAASSSEVFFQRDGAIRDNIYGSSINMPKEIGSLFNPYWQVRLVHSDQDVRSAQQLQGVTLN